MYFALDGGWDGPVSWRKPIEFGISGGLTALSLAVVMGRLPRNGWLAWPCGVAVALFVPETALIDLQRWRSVPSHFNHDTPFDLAVFDVMGVLVAIVALGIVVMTVWTFVSVRGPRGSAERTALPESRRASVVLLGIAGYALALIVATLQTFVGRAPLDLTSLVVVGGGAALLMLAFACAAGLRAAQVTRNSGGVPAN